MKTTFKIRGESLSNSWTWISEGAFDPETANLLCAEMNSQEMMKGAIIHYSTFIFDEAPEPARKPYTKSRYPKTPKAKARLNRLLDAVKKKG